MASGGSGVRHRSPRYSSHSAIHFLFNHSTIQLFDLSTILSRNQASISASYTFKHINISMSSQGPSTTRTPSPPSTPTSIDDLEAFQGLSISDIPESSLEGVRRFFNNMSDSAILEYTFGIDKPGAPELAEHTIVIAVDCEKFEYEPRCLTEYGLHTFLRKDMAPTLANPGAYGENMMRAVYYYHIRLRATAHYVNRKWCPGNPDNNRVGVTRFATDQQAKDFLLYSIAWPVDPKQPDGSKCPIVLLGHAVKNDLEMLQELGVDSSVLSNVVAVIDTQIIAKEKGIYGRGNEIGLATLMSQYGMVMGKKLPVPASRSLQDVVDDLEVYSEIVVPDAGTARYCTR
ncbi:hypothetical protein CC86DRAFT_383072 [Ophiobolus disseminans]|uniref:Gfd2/YDR514C-like C-terminal domain-containing protein n=1 Tax=Ophiobolus disseminans TaxID=1469910 RepID=A0A6A6ZVR1_9PLEO|nr:hypothetical protein CC86DRAFT_383072 [Ophiobolus disseminans]